jgi:hypothetical protein
VVVPNYSRKYGLFQFYGSDQTESFKKIYAMDVLPAGLENYEAGVEISK